MDEAARTSSSEVDEQEQRSPEEIRRDIEETREELGDTVEALAQKADVKGQAKAKFEGIKQSAQDTRIHLEGKGRHPRQRQRRRRAGHCDGQGEPGFGRRRCVCRRLVVGWILSR